MIPDGQNRFDRGQFVDGARYPTNFPAHKANPQERPANMTEVIRRLELSQHILDKNQATLTGPAIRGKRGPMQTFSSSSGDTAA